MNERAKITGVHLSRQAIVYLRQSSAAQVEHNRESTERQYALAAKARQLGWPEDRILVIDEDLPVRLHDPASLVSLLRLRSPASASCSVWRCRVLRATMPTGIASSISPA